MRSDRRSSMTALDKFFNTRAYSLTYYYTITTAPADDGPAFDTEADSMATAAAVENTGNRKSSCLETD